MSAPKHPGESAFRIAFRTEGDYVNAYFAPPKNMHGAVLVSSIRRSMLNEDKQLWEDWRQLMRMAFDSHLRRLGLEHDGWTETVAPCHERTGNA